MLLVSSVVYGYVTVPVLLLALMLIRVGEVSSKEVFAAAGYTMLALLIACLQALAMVHWDDWF